MWMTDYIREIQRQFIEVYGYPENPEAPGVPAVVPDGEYHMVIEGRTDRVQVTGGRVRCMNFDTAAQPATTTDSSPR
jgi:hypothetical protein